jgi:GT2 family glycosyltransferase
MKSLDLRFFDIILVNYNSTDHLLVCLKSIYYALNGLSSQIAVIDNDSKDNVERVTAAFPDIQLIKNTTNMGFAKAVNQGIGKSISPYIMLLNPDTSISEDFFIKALGFMKQHPDVGILGPKILDPDGSVQGSARSFPTPLTAIFGRTSLLTRLFPNNPFSQQNILTINSDRGQIKAVDWVSGACMVVRRKAIDVVGMMDERFFMYFEDADWCKRMWEAGWKVIYNPGISITHHVGTSSKKNFVKSSLEFHRSAFNFYKKHKSRLVFFFMFPLLVGGLALRFLLILMKSQRN